MAQNSFGEIVLLKLFLFIKWQFYNVFKKRYLKLQVITFPKGVQMAALKCLIFGYGSTVFYKSIIHYNEN